jgi:membrane-associated protein
MQEIYQYLLAVPADSLLMVIAGILVLTTLGIFPGNSELTILASGVLASLGKLNIFFLWPVLIGAVFLGESTMFFLGRFLGPKIFKWHWVEKRFPESKRNLMQAFLNQYLVRFLFTLRITPVLRPFVILTVGTLRVSVARFCLIHYVIGFGYITALLWGAYIFSQVVMTYFQTYQTFIFLGFFLVWGLFIFALSSKGRSKGKNGKIH